MGVPHFDEYDICLIDICWRQNFSFMDDTSMFSPVKDGLDEGSKPQASLEVMQVLSCEIYCLQGHGDEGVCGNLEETHPSIGLSCRLSFTWWPDKPSVFFKLILIFQNKLRIKMSMWNFQVFKILRRPSTTVVESCLWVTSWFFPEPVP